MWLGSFVIKSECQPRQIQRAGTKTSSGQNNRGAETGTLLSSSSSVTKKAKRPTVSFIPIFNICIIDIIYDGPKMSSHLRMSRGRCESRPGPTEGSLQSSAAAFYFTQILSGHLIAFHECSPFKYFSVDFVALFPHYFFNIFLNISMPEVPLNTTEALPAWVSTSRFVTEVKSSTAGAILQIISSFRENYSSEIMHNIYRYLHRLAFSVTFSS